MDTPNISEGPLNHRKIRTGYGLGESEVVFDVRHSVHDKLFTFTDSRVTMVSYMPKPICCCLMFHW